MQLLSMILIKYLKASFPLLLFVLLFLKVKGKGQGQHRIGQTSHTRDTAMCYSNFSKTKTFLKTSELFIFIQNNKQTHRKNITNTSNMSIFGNMENQVQKKITYKYM